MFARESEKRSQESSYRRLVMYLINPKGTKERVGRVLVTRCENDDMETALLEVANVQAANHRVQDKTFHLLVSFQPGDAGMADTVDRKKPSAA